MQINYQYPHTIAGLASVGDETHARLRGVTELFSKGGSRLESLFGIQRVAVITAFRL